MQMLGRIGVYLNDEPGDEEALAFAGYLAELSGGTALHCRHVGALERALAPPAPDSSALRERVLQRLPARAAASVEVSAANGLPEILRSARDLDLELIVIGRHRPHDQLSASSVFLRLARKAPCSVLIVPAFAQARLSRLLVYLDDAAPSRLALETAIALARATEDPAAQVLGQTVFDVGYGYRFTSRSLPEAVRRWEGARRDIMDVFLSDVDTTGVPFDLAYTCSQRRPEAILDLATVRTMDAIVLAGQYATAPAAMLLRNDTDRLLATASLPVLVVKRKGEVTRFLDALLSGG